jgi:hypothetical protein
VESFIFAYVEQVFEGGLERQEVPACIGAGHGVLEGEMVHNSLRALLSQQHEQGTPTSAVEVTLRRGLLSDFEMVGGEEQVAGHPGGRDAGSVSRRRSREEGRRVAVRRTDDCRDSGADDWEALTSLSVRQQHSLGGNGDKSSDNRVYLEVKRNGPTSPPILNNQTLMAKNFQKVIEESHMYRLFASRAHQSHLPVGARTQFGAYLD